MARGSVRRSAPRGGWAFVLLAAFVLLTGMRASPVASQELGLPDSAILVIDPGRLFAQSQFGQRINASIEQQGAALAEENRRIEAELTAEEKRLTEERPTMTPEAFRAKANAFDAKVREIRSTQDAKIDTLTQESDSAERRFLSVARPVLEELMVESGASVLLDTRSVLLSAGAVDVTREAVNRIDEVIGDGREIDLPAPENMPETTPETTPGAAPGTPSETDANPADVAEPTPQE